MSNIDKIKELPFLDILSKLGYHEGTHYILRGNDIKMKEDGKVTGGWNGEIKNGFLKCHSGKKAGRFEGDRISLVMDKFGIDKGEAITWLEDAFGLEKTKGPNKKEDTKAGDVWRSCGQLTEDQRLYLEGRGITGEAGYRNFSGSIGLSISTANKNIVSVQGRNIGETAKKMRYRLLPGCPARGLFVDWASIDLTLPVFLVEGMTDYGTLRQFTPQIMALVSKDNGIEEIKTLAQRVKFMLIPDNDEAGRSVEEKLSDMNMSTLSLSFYEDPEVKDVNDLWNKIKDSLTGEQFINMLKEDMIKPKKNIDFAIDKAVMNREVGSYPTGDKVFDAATGGITPGSVMIINGLSGEGKTTTLDWILSAIMEHGKRMGFCSIDDDIGKMLAMFLGRFFQKDWKEEIYPEIKERVDKYGKEKFDNMLLYDHLTTLDQFKDVILAEDLDVLVVDYIQVIEGLPGKDMKDKMLAASKGLQRLAIDTHTAIICLCQVSKGESQIPVINRTPMESQYIKSTADTFINVGVFNGAHKMGFVKNKYGATEYKMAEFDTHWDKKTGKITIWKDESTSSF